MLTRCLAVYSAVITTLLAIGILYAPTNAASKRQEIDEVTVHRLNVREPDGTLRLVMANRDWMPGVIVRGTEAPRRDRPQTGMIFYNDEGTEIGGLIFSGHRDATGFEIRDGLVHGTSRSNADVARARADQQGADLGGRGGAMEERSAPPSEPLAGPASESSTWRR
jgi:hypothetical protein